jgi:hypothetical protein
LHADSILTFALGFVAIWSGAVAVHALLLARDRKWDPLPPEMPEHHGHDDHGHGDHGLHDHGHADHLGHH